MPGIEWICLYIVLGAFVGFMAGLLGVGGGGILVPLLTLLFSWQHIGGQNGVHLALGTSLTCMIISSTASMRAHALRGAVAWRVVAGMAPGIIVGAFLATQVAGYVDATWIALFFGLFMAFVAAQLFLDWHPEPGRKPATIGGMVAAGAGIGSVSALAAVGGGFLTLAYLGYRNLDTKKAIGTAAAIGFPIAIAGTLGYVISGWSETAGDPNTLGFIYVPAFLAIAIASFVAAPVGARCAHSLPAAILKKIFAVVSLILSVTMLFSIIENG
jgi:uncharacterized membrane protein YfcA